MARVLSNLALCSCPSAALAAAAEGGCLVVYQAVHAVLSASGPDTTISSTVAQHSALCWYRQFCRFIMAVAKHSIGCRQRTTIMQGGPSRLGCDQPSVAACRGTTRSDWYQGNEWHPPRLLRCSWRLFRSYAFWWECSMRVSPKGGTWNVTARTVRRSLSVSE